MTTIALDFNLNKSWMGGSYYLRNLISALGTLPDAMQPNVALLSETAESVAFAMEAGYSKLLWIKSQDFAAAPEDYPFDAIFPWSAPDQAYRTVSWIPDFQELHLPYYFSDQEIATRRAHHRQRFAGAGLVVSSNDVRKDVDLFYPGECPNTAVVRFASFDRMSNAPLAEIKKRYGLPQNYIMCPNQVWIHKNHLLVLRAVQILAARGIRATMVFTGSESDYRVPGFSAFLRQKAQEWGIADHTFFLGFIPRDDQLGLMKGADFILQPSLFEGWSTTIEDAKAMQQFVVASDLPVHLEQLPHNATFFPRHNAVALAKILQKFATIPPKVEFPLNYEENRQAFGADFLAAVQKFMSGLPDRARKLCLEDLQEISRRNMIEGALITKDTTP